MDRINPHQQKYAAEKLSGRQARLLQKFSVKSFAEQFKTLFYFSIGCSFVFQIASLVTAVTLPASWFNAVFHNWAIGFLVAAVFLGMLEVVKRMLVKKAVKDWLQFGHKKMLFICLVPSILSIVSSTLGTPILVKEFGAAPSQADTSSVAQMWNEKINASALYWADLKQGALDKADEIHKKNSWKGVTTRSARPLELQQQAMASGYGDSAVVDKSRLTEQKAAAIAAVVNGNKQVIQQDKDSKQHAGMMLGALTFGLELVFICVLWFCEYYDYREALLISESDSEVIAEPQKVAESREKSGDSSEKVAESAETVTDTRQKIGFHVPEGTVKVNKHGTPVVAYKNKKGKIVWYREGQITSQITDAEKTADKTGDKTRLNRLRKCKKKLNSFNT